MAKKVKAKLDKAEVSALQAEFRDLDIEKQYGDILFSGENVFSTKKKIIIPVSPAADIQLGGGIPEGSLVVLAGQPKVGKSSLALKIAANAQKLEYAVPGYPEGRRVFILSVEARLADRDIEAYPFDFNRLSVVKSTKEKLLHAQDWLTVAELLLRKYPGCVVLIDSFSALCTEEEATSGMDKMQRADGAKLLAKFFRKVSSVIEVNDCLLLGVNHLMGNASGKGGMEWKEKGGQAVTYHANVRLRAKYHQYVTVGANEDAEKIGQTIHWQVLASPINRPGGEFESFLRYGEGIDDYMEIAKLAVDFDIIQAKGAWYTFNTIEGTPKAQGMEKVRLAIKQNPAWFEQLKSEILEMVGMGSQAETVEQEEAA